MRHFKKKSATLRLGLRTSTRDDMGDGISLKGNRRKLGEEGIGGCPGD